MLRFFFIVSAIFLAKTSLSQNCNNWLKISKHGGYATLGDIDVEGNQLTVEALFNRDQPLNNKLYPGHLVSKHTDQTNGNYSLFPNGCALTTTKGYFSTFEKCTLRIGETYHVAMVYDGSFLKFYRNGTLHSSVKCSGDLINNNFTTTIGQVSNGGSLLINQFLGYVNEVRIWSIARTEMEVQKFMNETLKEPKKNASLLAYYTFENLDNKQGNDDFEALVYGKSTIEEKLNNCDVKKSSGNYLTTKGKTNICEGEFVLLEAEKGNNYKYEWYKDGKVLINENSNYLKVTSTGEYGVKIETKECPVSQYVLINVNPYPLKKVTADALFLTKGKTVTLSAAAENVKYLWNTTSTTQTITINKPGQYFAKLDNNGCVTISDTIKIEEDKRKGFVDYSIRKNNLLQTINLKQAATFDILFYDYRQEDGDIISVFVNDKLVISNHLLSKTPLKIPITISKDNKVIEVKIVAENLGTIPPNTAMMQCIVNGKKHETQIVSSGEKNAVIKFQLN